MLLIHSIMRWALVLVAVVTLAKFGYAWLTNSSWRRLDTRLSQAFSILMDVQILIGLVLLVWSGLAGAGFPRERLEHAFIMILALVPTHLPMRWKNAPGEKRFRNTLLAYALALVLVIVGVALLPGGGWGRPFPPMFSLP